MAKGARPTTRAAREALTGKSDIPESNVQVGEFTRRKTKDPFFGEVLHATNKYFYVDQVKDNDSAIIMTSNIAVVKGNPVLVTGDNTAIYLKDWQFRRMISKDGIDTYAVKINRNYFKEYTFKSNFQEFSFGGKKDTFDSLRKVAIEQQKQKRLWKSGGRVIIQQHGIIPYA